MKKLVKYPFYSEHGYTMLEILVVCAIVGILATMPIVALRNARVKAAEVEAIASLNMMAVAYEAYNNQSRPHRYPHYLSNHATYEDSIDYRTAEEIWVELIRRSLLPKRFSNHLHNENNLLARGFRLSIFPYSRVPNFSNCPRYTYAMAMVPHEESQQPRAIAIFQGYNDGWMRLSPRARKLPGSGVRSDAKFYTWKDF